ncbi:MAG TPA: YihY/virulence factor BrkB family protein, partial [Salinimicrobium sp.]|nr:YihY/virulence factor BrkB family protein [Salinimicrobium sp.]
SETRSFFRLNGLTLLFTLAAMILVIIAMSLIVVFPAIKDLLGLPGYLDTLIRWSRWLLLAVIIAFSISVLYKVAPYKYRTSFKWVKPGAYIATVLWLIASWAFSFYVSNFGNYPEVYGSVSAVIVFLLWLYLSCFIIVLGAEVNSDMEAYAGKKYS